MTAVADYRCRECGELVEAPVALGQVATLDHGACSGRLDRVWSAPAIGSCSSGEPFRGVGNHTRR